MRPAELGGELSLADEHKAERLRAQQFGGAEHHVRAVQRAPLAVLEDGERLAGRRRPGSSVRAGLRQGPDRSHGQPTARKAERLLVVRGVRPGVGEHQVREPEGDLVHGADGGGFRAAAAHQPAVAGEGVQQRDERVEHEARVAYRRQHAPERHEEVAGVADDDRIHAEAAAVLGDEPRVCRGDARGEARCSARACHLGGTQRRQRGVELVDLHAELAQTRDEHGVAGIVRLVRPEVRDGPGHGCAAAPAAPREAASPPSSPAARVVSAPGPSSTAT